MLHDDCSFAQKSFENDKSFLMCIYRACMALGSFIWLDEQHWLHCDDVIHSIHKEITL